MINHLVKEKLPSMGMNASAQAQCEMFPWDISRFLCALKSCNISFRVLSRDEDLVHGAHLDYLNCIKWFFWIIQVRWGRNHGGKGGGKEIVRNPIGEIIFNEIVVWRLISLSISLLFLLFVFSSLVWRTQNGNLMKFRL